MEISIGDTVQDLWGEVGTVIDIEKGFSIEDHGCITVQQSDGEEHYSHINWEEVLTIIKRG